MSAMSVSKSYAVLLGLEGYTKTRRKIEGVGRVFRKKDGGEGKEKDGSWKGKERKGNGEGEKVLVIR